MEKGKFKATLKKRRKLLIVLGIIVIIIILLAIGGRRAGQQAAQSQYTLAAAEYRDISVVVNAASTVAPLDSYSVIALVYGDVVEAPCEEGAIVNEGDLLFQIDTADASGAHDQARLTLENARNSYNSVYDTYTPSAKVAGCVKLNCHVGDYVTAGSVLGEVTDDAAMRLELPFHAADAQNIYVGQAASVTLSLTGEQLTGTVKSVGGADTVGAGGVITRTVAISVNNPGGLTAGSFATAIIGDSACAGSGVLQVNASSPLVAGANGKISEIYVKDGSLVKAGTPILAQRGAEITTQLQASANAVKSAEIGLENAQDALDNYTITAPISGTLVAKNAKAGDTIDTTDSGQPLAVIYDLSAMEIVLNIDELDIRRFVVGQQVTITADALPEQKINGTVERVGLNGVAMNGVTFYPVTVRIDDYGDLLPGMNVTADVMIEQADHVLTIPLSAVSRGNTVLVVDAASTGDLTDGVPAGYRRVEVELGRNDEDYIEVLSGLSEGDQVAIDNSTSSIMDMMMM